jgi:hypothetical protein
VAKKQVDETEPQLLAKYQIGEDNQEIAELGLLLPEMIGFLTEEAERYGFRIVVIALGFPGDDSIVKGWSSLWFETVRVGYLYAPDLVEHDFIIRERIFYREEQPPFEYLSDPQPIGPFFERSYFLNDYMAPHTEGLIWRNQLNFQGESINRRQSFMIAKRLLDLLYDERIDVWRQVLFDALDKYIEKYPQDKRIFQTRLMDCIPDRYKRERTTIYKLYEKQPVLQQELRARFDKKKREKM